MIEKGKNLLRKFFSNDIFIPFLIGLLILGIVFLLFSMFSSNQIHQSQPEVKKLIGEEFVFDEQNKQAKNSYVFRVQNVGDVLGANEVIMEMKDEVGYSTTQGNVKLFPSGSMDKIRREKIALYNEEVEKFCKIGNKYSDYNDKVKFDFFTNIKSILNNNYFFKKEWWNMLYISFKYECKIPSVKTRQMLFREALLNIYWIRNFEVLNQKDIFYKLISEGSVNIHPRMIGNFIYKKVGGDNEAHKIDWQFFQDKCIFNLEREFLQGLKDKSKIKTYDELQKKIQEEREKRIQEAIKIIKSQNPNVDEKEIRKEVISSLSLANFHNGEGQVPLLKRTTASDDRSLWTEKEKVECKKIASKYVDNYMMVDRKNTITELEIYQLLSTILKNKELLFFMDYSISNDFYIPVQTFANLKFWLWRNDEGLIDENKNQDYENFTSKENIPLEKQEKEEDKPYEIPKDTNIWPILKK